MKRVVFHPAANREARAAARRYEKLRAGLGVELQAELDAAVNRVEQTPRLYAAESGAIRVCPLHRFPYSLFYEELADRIWVAAVGHHSRRPRYWKRRRPKP